MNNLIFRINYIKYFITFLTQSCAFLFCGTKILSLITTPPFALQFQFYTLNYTCQVKLKQSMILCVRCYATAHIQFPQHFFIISVPDMKYNCLFKHKTLQIIAFFRYCIIDIHLYFNYNKLTATKFTR